MEIIFSNATGNLIRHPNFASQNVQARNVDVWQPPTSLVLPGARLPVIYMHDGQNLFLPNIAFGRQAWDVHQAILTLMAQKRIPGAIVVGIWNSGDDRWREYTPQKPMETPAGLQFSSLNTTRITSPIISDRYLKFIVEELKPLIDETYPTLPDQPNTYVMGSSMGGLISLYALCRCPDIFHGAGCLSTHWPAGEQLLVDYFCQAVPQPGRHRLYFDFGDQDLDAAYEPWQTRLDDCVRRAGYIHGADWLTRKFPGAGHSESAWRERVQIPLEFLLK